MKENKIIKDLIETDIKHIQNKSFTSDTLGIIKVLKDKEQARSVFILNPLLKFSGFYSLLIIALILISVFIFIFPSINLFNFDVIELLMNIVNNPIIVSVILSLTILGILDNYLGQIPNERKVR